MMSKGGTSTAAEVKETFNLFNKSGSGTISAGELKDIMTALGEKVTDEVSVLRTMDNNACCELWITMR